MLITLVLVFIITVLLCQHIYLVQRHWKKKQIPYSTWTSIKGTLELFFMKISLGMFCEDLYKKTEADWVGFHIFRRPCLLIRDLDLIKQILVKDFQYFPDRTVATNYEADPLGTRVLFVEKNPVWKFIRSKVSAAFSSGRMKFIYPNMVDIGDNFVEYLTENQGNYMEMKETCAKFSTDVVTSCAFGVQENSFQNDKSLSREASRRIFVFNFSRGIQFNCYFIAPFLVKLFGMTWLDPSAAKFVKDMYEDIKQKRKLEAFRNDYVGTLIKLEEQNVYHTDPKEVLSQAAQFFLAGFETVASTLMYAMYEMAHNQDIQDRLREEIRDGVSLSNGELTYDTLLDMKYLTMVLTETLRKYPLVPFLDRRAVDDYQIPNTNIVIEKGTNVYISTQGIHHDPKYFPDPKKFDPERFSDKNKDTIVHNSYLPFGDGPRNCIGARFGKLSVLVGLAKIVEKFRITGGIFEELTYDSRGFLLSPDRDVLLTFNKI